MVAIIGVAPDAVMALITQEQSLERPTGPEPIQPEAIRPEAHQRPAGGLPEFGIHQVQDQDHRPVFRANLMQVVSGW